MEEKEKNIIDNNVSDNLMKNKKLNIVLLFNLILFIGLIILYVLYFYGKRETNPKELIKINKNLNDSTNSISIAFINADTIMSNYELVNKLQKNLESQKDKMENKFLEEQKKLKKDAAKFQEKVQYGSFLTQEDAKKEQQRLLQKQQELYNLKENFTQQLMDKETQMNLIIQDSIINFLKRYNKNYNYSYILGSSRGSGILYANKNFDITQEILTGINKEYKDSQQK